VTGSDRQAEKEGGGALPGELVLRDGTPAMIWPLLPSDRAMLREGFAALSERSRYLRFLSSIPELTEPMLQRLVEKVDGIDHVALICVALPEHGEDCIVGVGRLIRYADDPAAADIAVTVADQWQGRGVGTALIESLLDRRPKGVRQLRTITAADNVPALAMLASAGPLTTRMEHGVVEVHTDLSTGHAPRAQRSGVAAAPESVDS
jgi:GNAT superfamily N-acetyltransferase